MPNVPETMSLTLKFVSVTVFLALQLVYSANMDAESLSKSIIQFSAKFCNELEKNKSFVSSPLSAEFVLALLTLGTSDPAHSELLTALGVPSDDAIRTSFSSISSNLKSVSGVTLNVANKVYIKEGNYDLHEDMKRDAVKVFDAELEKVDFGKSVAAAELINKWVESKTNSKIKDLLSSDSLSDDTRLVLVNALYFKGTWKKQFDPNMTRDMPFHVNINSTVNVAMMYKEDHFRYGTSEQLNAQILQLPYVGDQTSMVIVLPNEIEGLNGVIEKLAAGYDLNSEISKLYSTKVKTFIPKFKIETEIDLNVLLPKLGIKAIFDRNNSGLTKLLNSDERLVVSKAVQKAFIEVNEEGAEAAAATAMGIMQMCALVVPKPVPVFKADRPFLVTINVGATPYFVATHCGDQ